MDRRCFMAASLAALAPLPGCGLAMRKLEGEPILAVGTATRMYPDPSFRVAIATLEALRLEFPTADLARGRDLAFSKCDEMMKADGTLPKEEDAHLPPHFPAFWMDLPTSADGRTENVPTIFLSGYFDATTRDGRPVEVAVRFRGTGTLVTAHVGKLGDAEVSRVLFDRIADRLAHPNHPAGSLEERRAVRAFFDGKATRDEVLGPGPAKAETSEGESPAPGR